MKRGQEYSHPCHELLFYHKCSFNYRRSSLQKYLRSYLRTKEWTFYSQFNTRGALETRFFATTRGFTEPRRSTGRCHICLITRLKCLRLCTCVLLRWPAICRNDKDSQWILNSLSPTTTYSTVWDTTPAFFFKGLPSPLPFTSNRYYWRHFYFYFIYLFIFASFCCTLQPHTSRPKIWLLPYTIKLNIVAIVKLLTVNGLILLH